MIKRIESENILQRPWSRRLPGMAVEEEGGNWIGFKSLDKVLVCAEE